MNHADLKAELIKILQFAPSDEQMTAITAPLEPGMIVAGAGTGKTTVMSARIIWLIMTKQVSPDRILGLTFTTKAAHELMTRVRKMLKPALVAISETPGDSDFGEPIISTYNSFGSRLLKEHALRLGVEPDARVVVDATRFQLAMRVVTNSTLPLGTLGFNPKKAVEGMLALDENCSNYMIDPRAVIADDEARIVDILASGDTKKTPMEVMDTCHERIALARLVLDFRQAKIDNGIIDYADQIRLAAQAAQTSPEMCEIVREQYHVVLLDEYQDTSVSQKVLLTSLFGGGHPVMAVGDPCQAIYGWRGAEVSNMENFGTDFARADGSKAETYSLATNRRSGVNILSAANDMSGSLRLIHRSINELISGREDLTPGEVHTTLLPTLADEVTWIAEQVAALQGTEKSWSDIAVLIRARKNTGLYVEALEKLNIPIQVVSADALAELPEVREILSYLEIIADPAANPALVRILMSPRWNIGMRDMAVLGRHANSLAPRNIDSDSIELQLAQVAADVDSVEAVSLLDALELAGEQNTFHYSREALERFAALASELRSLRRYAGDSAIDVINRIVRVTGMGIEALSRQMAEGNSRFDRIAALLDVAGDFRSIEGDSTVHAFLRYLRDGERFNKTPDSTVTIREDAVVIMTIHQSKGLEFPVVVLPEMTDGVFPSVNNKDGHWPTSSKKIPSALLPKSLDPNEFLFPNDKGYRSTDYDAYKKSIKAMRILDERRLAYVAITRAEHKVIASASWWGPTQKDPRGPSEFMRSLHSQATHPGEWTDAPEDNAVNPLKESREYKSWPIPVDEKVIAAINEQGNLVRAAISRSLDAPNLDAEDAQLVQEWNADIEALISQIALAQSDTRVVHLPESLTVSNIIALTQDPESFAKALIRPMPRKPSPAASRGTAFHLWVEHYFDQPALLDIDDLPGAVDADIYTDDQLAALKDAFTSGPFGQRMPRELELPFALVVGGRTWRGRIDAVFNGSLADPTDGTRYLVVDWKTGRAGSANELQLNLYRHAVASALNVDADRVEAAFYYVLDDVVTELSEPLTLEQLTALVSATT